MKKMKWLVPVMVFAIFASSMMAFAYRTPNSSNDKVSYYTAGKYSNKNTSDAWLVSEHRIYTFTAQQTVGNAGSYFFKQWGGVWDNVIEEWRYVTKAEFHKTLAIDDYYMEAVAENGAISGSARLYNYQ